MSEEKNIEESTIDTNVVQKKQKKFLGIKISDDLSENYIPILIIVIVILVLFPIIIFCITEINISPEIGFINDDNRSAYIGFYSSIIGGSITLIGVLWTIKNQTKIRSEENKQYEKYRKEDREAHDVELLESKKEYDMLRNEDIEKQAKIRKEEDRKKYMPFFSITDESIQFIEAKSYFKDFYAQYQDSLLYCFESPMCNTYLYKCSLKNKGRGEMYNIKLTQVNRFGLKIFSGESTIEQLNNSFKNKDYYVDLYFDFLAYGDILDVGISVINPPDDNVSIGFSNDYILEFEDFMSNKYRQKFNITIGISKKDNIITKKYSTVVTSAPALL